MSAPLWGQDGAHVFAPPSGPISLSPNDSRQRRATLQVVDFLARVYYSQEACVWAVCGLTCSRNVELMDRGLEILGLELCRVRSTRRRHGCWHLTLTTGSILLPPWKITLVSGSEPSSCFHVPTWVDRCPSPKYMVMVSSRTVILSLSFLNLKFLKRVFP